VGKPCLDLVLISTGGASAARPPGQSQWQDRQGQLASAWFEDGRGKQGNSSVAIMA
jgi:hypothetical protein